MMNRVCVRCTLRDVVFDCILYLCYVAGVLQVVLKQLRGSVLKGLGQSCQQHAELRSVELEQRD